MDSETSSNQVEDSDDSILDFNELNDAEFDLPTAVLPPPSLESILWDLDSRASSDNVSEHSHRSSAGGTTTQCSAAIDRVKSMMHHNVLQGISAQVKSAEGKVGAGSPTSVANCSIFVSVGTSHGYLLTFDAEQKLCWCCYDSVTLDQGAVSAIAFNGQSTRILVGFERGYILQLNAHTGDVVRRLASDADAHAPHSAVLQLRYCAQTSAHPTPLALVGDSSGCIFQIALARRLGVRTTRSRVLCTLLPAMGDYSTIYIKQEPVDIKVDIDSTLDARNAFASYNEAYNALNSEFVSVGVKEEQISKVEVEDEPDYVDLNSFDDGPYECLICHKWRTTKQTLRIHIALHNGRYQCKMCFKRYGSQNRLKHHMRAHTEEKPYGCDICHKRFTTKSSRTIHMRTHIIGEKPHSCGTCHKRYNTISHLREHQRTHTGAKPFQCNICHKCFAQHQHLTRHKRTHTGERAYECHICHKRFTQNSCLSAHLRTHTGEKPFQCDICHKRFTQSRGLALHTLLHTGEKLYRCSICCKQFARNTTLTVHMRTHTGEKPFECNICHKRFIVQSHLTAHMRTHR